MTLSPNTPKIHEPVLYNFENYGLGCDLSDFKLGSVVEIALASKEHLQVLLAVITPDYMLGQVITPMASIPMGEILKFGACNVMIL